jgi:transcriptional regulator with GAF, ATPase, and Fis domain
LGIFLTAFSIKAYLLINLIFKKTYSISARLPYFFIIGVLVSTFIQDTDWVSMLITKLFLYETDSILHVRVFWMRISWAFTIMQYQFITLFMESLVSNNYKINIRQKIFIVISTLIFLFFIGIAIVHNDCTHSSQKYAIELYIQNFLAIYALFPLMLSSFFVCAYRLQKSEIPRILRKQLTLVLFVVVPFWLMEFLQILPLLTSSFSSSISWLNTGYGFVTLSTIFLTSGIVYCSRRILGYRFLNFKSHVQSSVDINFMENFKTTLEQFSRVSNMQELGHITQSFFKEAFGIPINRTHLYIRNLNSYEHRPRYDNDTIYPIVETFMGTHSKQMCNFINQSKMLAYDELAFSNFYETTHQRQEALQFMEAIQADLFIPIYENGSLIAYIIVDRHARLHEFYNSTEYDEIMIFASYLGNIINLMQTKNLDTLVQQEKALQEELYNKHQEINQYKESIRSFLRTNKQKDIGIVFYKNRRFTFGNQAAKQLLKINPNMQEGHALTKALVQVAQHVEAYKTPKTVYAKDSDGTKLVFAGVPSLESNNVIISVYHPEVSDVIKKQIDMLKDPSEWDYLLYLETTKPGQLINQLIPGSGETLLNFKIELLKASLTKKATLLNMPDDDLKQMVELLHHISLRETLHILDLETPITNFDVAIKLFGINTIYGMKIENTPPLLEKLDNIGTLFIKNIHYLDLETQEYLAEFIRYGIYRVFKSDQKVPSNVRIICSSNQNLANLVREGKFSAALFNELKHTTLEMPSLMTLPEQELNTLAEGFSEQTIADPTYKNILSLSDKDKIKLVNQRPASLLEFKSKVQSVLMQKSKKNDIYHETQFDPAYDVSDPNLMHAARLGKHALKDRKIMGMLWDKFKNQNKIASFLGVNRSSVNRRCKEYNLE